MADKILVHTLLVLRDFYKTNQQYNLLARWDHRSHKLCQSNIVHICLRHFQSMFRLILVLKMLHESWIPNDRWRSSVYTGIIPAVCYMPYVSLFKTKLSTSLELLGLNIRIQRYKSPANWFRGFRTLNSFEIDSHLKKYKLLEPLEKLALVPAEHSVHSVAFALEKYPGSQISWWVVLGHWEPDVHSDWMVNRCSPQ